MSRNLPPPATVNDFYMAAAVDLLGEAVGLLREIRDRKPEPVNVTVLREPEPVSDSNADGPGSATVKEATVEQPADEVVDPKPKAGAIPVTEPAPVKSAKPATKKATPKPVKES